MNHPQQKWITAGLLATSLLISSAEGVRAQQTPPFNPEAGDPADILEENSGDADATETEGTDTEDSEESGSSGGFLDDINDEIGNVEDIVEDTTSDVQGAIEEQIGGVTEEVEGATDGVLGENGLGDINETIGGAFEAFEGIQGTIDSLTDTFSSIFDISRLMDILNFNFLDIFEDPLGGLLGGGEQEEGDSVEITTGALGLPDPKVIEEEINNAQSSPFEEAIGTKTGGDGSPVIKLDLVTQFERNLTDEVANQTALTEDGQQKLRENAEAATTALETSQELAADSQGQDVSQNILRNISGQLAAQQQTGSLTTIDNQLRARDDALRNKMLVDAVRELQGERIQDRRETSSAYSDAITQGAQLILPGVGINPANGGDD